MFAVAFCMLIVNCGLLQSAETPPNAKEKSTELATIGGKITYRIDSKRPWRYRRYYIRSPKTGELSEAVVSLRAKRKQKSQASYKSKTYVIDQKNHSFYPETTVLHVGDRVQFTNSDPGVHNVFADRLSYVFSFNLTEGQKFEKQFDKPVSAKRPIVLGCKYHSSMRAWIYVFDHPYYQLTAKDGHYRLENVPPGEYRLEVAHPAGDLWHRQNILIRGGEKVTVNIRLSPENRVD